MKKDKKGTLTINGIFGIIISLVMLGLTLPLQQTYIALMLNATTRDASSQLIINSIIPFELLMMLAAVVYAGRSVRASVEDWRG